MSAINKAKNETQHLVGKAKETVGGATGNRRLKNEGRLYQGSANLKHGLEHVKGAAGEAKDKLAGN